MSDLAWRRSSYSSPQGENCVELAAEGAVRDSKNPGGPVLNVDVTALVAAAKTQSNWRYSRRIGHTTGT
ncbi:MAG TPA: DUF397 domain-containing protein [Pseudonocardiaceae bacterium]|nr:DUF397 domain-containing protein [Pseudonocardiaceae bacterium]